MNPEATPTRQHASSRRALTVGVLTLLSAIATGVGPANARAQPPVRNHEADRRCAQCHGQEHIATLGPAQRLSMVGTWLDTASPAEPPRVAASSPGDDPPTRPGLLVTPASLADSPHAALDCVACHEDAARLPHPPRLQKATCASSCHPGPAASYDLGAHRAALDRGDRNAPTCASCHGGHDISCLSDRRAPQNRLNSLFLCADCHSRHRADGEGDDPKARITDYLASTHARAITRSGLPMAATCADCHGAHGVLPHDDPDSTVNRARIPETCGKCHVGVAEVYATSVHGRRHAEHNGKAAVCTDCHTAHQISVASTPAFIADVVNECGRCHDSPDANGERVGTYYKTYHRSYHGQATSLGGERAARCSDCHGSHDIRPNDDPASRVNAANLVGTCARCHPAANAQFVKFDPHADHRDAANYPLLHGVWLYFMVMMSAVFTFFGVHSLLWFGRSTAERARHGPRPAHASAPTAIRRFDTTDRVNHALVAITFFGLTATGIPLVFAEQGWARAMARAMGGVDAAGIWHRFFAVLLILNLALHFVTLVRRFRKRTCSRREWLLGPHSLAPRWKDAKDIAGMFRWFVGRGPRPKFDRWTYWEKFDYWAEVGGSLIIGGSGLLLWFPELASKILPGWAFNIAMIVHGYEALLAIGFIFTIHFFNAHLRPGTFPVDEVIFTGSQPEHELKEQRPEEYERLVRTGALEALRVPAPPRSRRPMLVAIALASVGFGLTLLVFILIGGVSS